MTWFYVYVYVRLPLTFLGAVTWVAVNPLLALFLLLLHGCLFFGLHRRRLWGWQLNWCVLAVEALLYPLTLGLSDDAGMMLLPIVILSLVWVLPNAIYFKKRQHLFT